MPLKLPLMSSGPGPASALVSGPGPSPARVAALAGALALCAAAPPARAGDRNELAIGSWSRALRSSSANAVTGDDLTGGALAFGRDLGLGLGPRLAVWATGAFTWSGASGTLFQTLGTELDVLGLSAGARARYQLHPRVIASARLDAGAARTRLQLTGAGVVAEDARWGAIATAAAGLDLFAIAGPRFSLGLRFELGYTAAQAPALSLSPAGADGEVMPLPAHQAAFGHLDLGGRWAGVSLVAQL